MKRTKIRILLLVSVGILSLAYPSAQQMPPPRPKPSAAEPAKPRPRPVEKEKAPEATLVITADMAATLSVDANEIGSFAQHEVRSIRVGLGQHLVRAVAGDLMWEQVVTADKAVQMVVRTGLLEVKAQREKAQAAQAAQRETARPTADAGKIPAGDATRAADPTAVPTSSGVLKGLTRAAAVDRLGPPSSVGDGISADKGCLIYDTIEYGRLYVYLNGETVLFWFPATFPLERLKSTARATTAQRVR